MAGPYHLPSHVLKETFAHFRDCGGGRRECQVLWVSPWDSLHTITKAIHPEHKSHVAGFVLDNQWLNDSGLVLRKEIWVFAAKCIPTRAKHSTRKPTTPFLSSIPSDFSLWSFRNLLCVRLVWTMPTSRKSSRTDAGSRLA